jgi:preprotein translocase subunit Sss1
MTRRINRPPTVLTKKSAESISEVRRAQISDAANKDMDNLENSTLSGSIAHSPGFRKRSIDLIKRGSIASPMPGPTTSASSDRMSPEIYSPLFQLANLNLPRDRVTMNAWNRVFYDTHPIVRNAINLHASYPISKINITCKNKKVQQFFMEMAEKIDLYSVVYGAALEFWKMGEKLSKNSMLAMSDGSLKKISDVKIGDEVITHLGNTKKVLNLFKKPTNTVIEEHLKVHKVTVLGLHEPLIISGRHPMLTAAKEEYMCTTPSCKKKNIRILPGKTQCSNCRKKMDTSSVVPDFVFANRVSVGDAAYSPFSKIENDIDDITKDLCYVMGFWAAEGCYAKAARKNYTKYNGIKFSNYDKSLIEKVALKLEGYVNCGLTGSTFTQDKLDDKVKYDYQFEADKRGGPELAEFFMKNCGEYSYKKVFSQMIMDLPVDKQLEILAGFADGDGCIDKDNGQLILSTSSEDMANQFCLMLRRAGANPTISKAIAKHNGKEGRLNYRIKIIANEAYDLFHGRLLSPKNEELFKTKWSASRSAIHNNWQILKITNIEDITETFEDDFMYDIEVEDDHSYVANGIAVHNCFPYAELDENQGTWSRITILNPDYAHVKKTVVGNHTMISLRPDATLQRLVNSTAPSDLSMRKFIPKHILNYVRRGQNIPLDAFNVSHLKLLSSPYDVRGTSIVVSVYKDLMLYDKLRESKFAQADGMINPLTLVTLGGEGDYRPTQADIEAFKNLLEEAQYDKDFKIVTHNGVKIERAGFSGATLDTAADIEHIVTNLYAGLMTPKSLMDQESATYASSSVGLEVLRQRYDIFRNMIKKWLERKIFAPICEIQDFFEYVDGEKRLLVPSIDFNHMNLYDMADFITSVGQFVGNQQVSLQTLHRSLGLSYEEERRRIREEMIDNQIFAKEQQVLGNMKLTELLSLDPSKSITEPPGAAGGPAAEGGLPGVEDGGMPPEMGGMPPEMGGMPSGGEVM